MKKYKILALLFFTFHFAFSQIIKVEFLVKNDSLPKKERKDFIYLEKNTDVSNAKYIGRLKVINKQNSIYMAVYLLKDKAQKKGANSFKFIEFKNENNINELVIDAYVINEDIKLINKNNLPKNKLFFFGKDNIEKQTTEEYSLNDDLKQFKSFHYTIVDFDKEVKIYKGKAFGSSLILKPSGSNNLQFINFSGFGASSTSMASGGAGLSFSGGSIIEMDADYGLLLTNIFTLN